MPEDLLKIEAPDRLWKYRVWDAYSHKMIVEGEFYFQLIGKLNDPFEFRWRDSIPLSAEILKKVARDLVEKRHPYLPPYAKETAVRNIHGQIQAQAAKGRSLTSVSTKGLTLGVFCASQVNDDILMWSHYAGHHSGVCVGFRPKRIVDYFFFPVLYSQTVPVIDVQTYTSNDISLVMSAGLTKSEHWKYEQEWRSVWSPGIYHFPNSVDQVVIGAFATRETRHAVYEAVKQSPQKIQVFEAKLSETHYKLDLRPLNVKRIARRK